MITGLRRIYAALVQLFLPFHSMSKSLAILCELYELDLANREKPIYRVTESPSKDDTEVTYFGEQVKRSKADELADIWANEE